MQCRQQYQRVASDVDQFERALLRSRLSVLAVAVVYLRLELLHFFSLHRWSLAAASASFLGSCAESFDTLCKHYANKNLKRGVQVIGIQ